MERVRQDFEVLCGAGAPVYLDSACMSLKPRQVLEKMNEYYAGYPGCGGRSSHFFSERVDSEVKAARQKTAGFLNAGEKEIVFCRNTTEAINFVAGGFSLSKGDSVVVSGKEHNSNLLPWLSMQRLGVRVSGLDGDNCVSIEDFSEKVRGAKLASLVFTSNLDGTTIDAQKFVKVAHENGALVVLDAAQAAPHSNIDVKKLDVDFLAFSGHKLCAPNATGVLYGKQELLEKLSPVFVGGETVRNSFYNSFELERAPNKFEYGLLNYSGIAGLGAAIDYVSGIGLDRIKKHCVSLNRAASEVVSDSGRAGAIGPADAAERGAILNLLVGKRFHELALFLNEAYNIMVRSGRHCCHSWFNAKGIGGSLRASFYFYNTEQEAVFFAEKVVEAL